MNLDIALNFAPADLEALDTRTMISLLAQAERKIEKIHAQCAILDSKKNSVLAKIARAEKTEQMMLKRIEKLKA